PARAYDEGRALAEKWHGKGRNRYAVTPRFSLSTTPEMLDSCASLVKEMPDLWVTSHVNENLAEVAEVARLFEDSVDYVDTYDRFGLVGSHSVFAHNVHATDRELRVLAERGAKVAHCPTSNSSLGSGRFPLRRHVEAGVHVALGSDVGGGTGLSMLKEGLQAYFVQQLHENGLPLTAAHLLYLATAAGATALGLEDEVGDLGVGRQFDAVWVNPPSDSTLARALDHARSPDDALAKVFAMGTVSDTAGVWVAGQRLAN
ncbi:MAG: amidohydrolase family protein, partial [Actinomycetota bacterium]|nr:amidohydrolase family protein [Actinomycetota bacterium]